MNAISPIRFPRLTRLIATLAALAAMALTSGCGGSGGGSNSSTGNSDTGQTGSPASEVGPFTISGVAAIGAPLLGATITVIDGKGVEQGRTRTNTSDGSYALALTGSHIPLPLLLQASGVDMTGKPVILHSVVQTSTAGATRGTANITNVTDAVVAMLLGTDPAIQFQSAGSLASTWTLLADTTALSSASDLVKTIAKPVITDTKVANPAKIDFFQDASFSANKTGADAILEGLHIQVGKDRAGRDQLEFSSRLKQPSDPEVTVNLGVARTQLALGSTGKVANAITSSAKVTSSATTLLNNVGTLDNLGTTLNRALAERNTSSMIVLLPIFSSYTNHNGVEVSSLAAQLAQYGSNGWQLSRFQFTGCADDPMPAKGCNLAQVSALLSDATGQVVGVFDNVVKYDASAGWVFQGNGKLSNWSVIPAAWRAWGSSGQSTGSGQGVQLAIKPITDTLFSSLTLPSGYTVQLLDCQMGNWCLSATATGDLITDSFLQAGTLGWYGAQQDSTRGAIYRLSAQAVLAQEVSTAILPQDVPTDAGPTAFPRPDGLSAGSPLTCTQILAGTRVTWNSWAASNPTLRMQSVYSVVTGAAHLPWVQTAPVTPLSDTVTDVPAVASPPASPTACQLWMVAHDKLGRRYISRIVAANP